MSGWLLDLFHTPGSRERERKVSWLRLEISTPVYGCLERYLRYLGVCGSQRSAIRSRSVREHPVTSKKAASIHFRDDFLEKSMNRRPVIPKRWWYYVLHSNSTLLQILSHSMKSSVLTFASNVQPVISMCLTPTAN